MRYFRLCASVALSDIVLKFGNSRVCNSTAQSSIVIKFTTVVLLSISSNFVPPALCTAIARIQLIVSFEGIYLKGVIYLRAWHSGNGWLGLV
jgi:hypothetical protein